MGSKCGLQGTGGQQRAEGRGKDRRLRGVPARRPVSRSFPERARAPVVLNPAAPFGILDWGDLRKKFFFWLNFCVSSLVAQMVKNLPAVWETGFDS